MTIVIETEHLSKVFTVRGTSGTTEDFVAVQNLSFTVEAGESLAIVGESGSGKTTSARMVAGLEVPTAGVIRVDGQERPPTPWKRRDRLRFAQQIQMVYQDPFSSLDPRQTVEAALDEILKFHFSLRSPERSKRIAELLDQVALQDRHRDRRPRSLSGGERQRVAIARALAVRPRALIFDESVSALDVSVQAQVLNLLNDLRDELRISYLFISHDLGVVRQVSDNCIVMHQGAVVEKGPTETILSQPHHAYTCDLLAAIPRPGWSPRRRTVRPVTG